MINSEQDRNFGMGSIQSLGVMNALKTGDPKLDTIVALLLPFALKFLLDYATKIIKYIEKWWKQKKENAPAKYHTRSITFRSKVTSQGDSINFDTDSQNSILIKAIRLYLDENVDLRLTDADLSLTTTEDNSFGGRRIYSHGRTIVGMLSNYRILKNAPHNEWHNLGTYGKTSPSRVELKIEIGQRQQKNDDRGENSEEGNKNIQETTFRFRSQQGQALDDFIQTAYNWYMDELKKSEDTSRYYYELQEKDRFQSATNARTSPRQYTRFQLSDEKTFQSLFFRDKDPVLKLVNSFMGKKGKYAIKGYPHKLGILLHGPPGTGKTSFIKALAEHTGRHIVNVPLAKISTNAELMSIFFDKRYWCQGQAVNITLDFKDVIFVMEDIDAASDVVQRRDGKKTAEMIQTEHIDMPPPKSLWRMLVESSDNECKKLVDTLMKKSERLKGEATESRAVHSVAKRMMALPALGLVGETDDKTLQQLSSDAVRSSQTLLQQYAAVDKFMSVHARTIRRLLDEGAEVDALLADELLGIEKPSLPPLIEKPLSRDVSYTKYSDSDKVHVELTELKEALMKPAMLQPIARGEENVQAEGGFKSIATTSPYTSMFKEQDSLNLTGILNVLDGVVDTPSRIVIMTTNHPEHLDPALIRPGRIDKKLHLGYMAAPDVISMMEHYFQITLDSVQRLRIETTLAGDVAEMRPRLNMTPAQVEQLTAEYDSVDEMIHELGEKGKPAIPVAAPLLGTTANSEITYGGL